jgi:hypothetical protein
MSKKPYTPPTVSNLGKIVVETKGWGGTMWEYAGKAPFGAKTPPKE